MKFITKRELKDLSISVLVLALAFSSFNLQLLPLTLFIVIAAFASHEILGHKLVAQHFGCSAEYVAWPLGLFLAIITSFFGFIFAAPGAVMISPVVRKRFAFSVAHLTDKEFGLIALAGPAVNIALGISFIIFLKFYPALEFLLWPAARISLFLAIFNLFPISPLDGQKVFSWSWKVWGAVFALAALSYAFL